ncbi:hypothetical protein PQJ75_00960 [Rhodoplanes sp. TEM]|uniref:Uncharacterized protein n=1 Tax=Rhodoplanes tepidamans TaxID=200616 RepID=A0ABT5J5F0_RHOTP|nr:MULTISPECIES: hypothetical protein [Rhodoplanes]MDC7784823.1 hypothetical protein [Rhodoplanes tepidamans]MDC7982290.1 hypothetical protein [Rhodoplanes sp. TEM]MDQ0356298.1 hypothetical protein [Rhodoplanes tepidamans]
MKIEAMIPEDGMIQDPREWSREGWTTEPEELEVRKVADATGPAFKASGKAWTRGGLALVLVNVAVAPAFVEAVKKQSGQDLTGFKVGVVLLTHLATSYPLARFATIEDAAAAVELSESVGDWWEDVDHALVDKIAAGTAKTPESVMRVSEVWRAAGFVEITLPPAEMSCLVMKRQFAAPQINA